MACIPQRERPIDFSSITGPFKFLAVVLSLVFGALLLSVIGCCIGCCCYFKYRARERRAQLQGVGINLPPAHPSQEQLNQPPPNGSPLATPDPPTEPPPPHPNQAAVPSNSSTGNTE